MVNVDMPEININSEGILLTMISLLKSRTTQYSFYLFIRITRKLFYKLYYMY
jgi:hypothetical protein